MIKWIISDMDGTLLKDGHKLPGDFAEMMKKLAKAKIKFSPASGRQYANLRQMFKDYPDLVYISDNGTYVVEKEQEVFSATLPAELVGDILKEVAKLNNIFPILSCKGIAYYNSKEPLFLQELNNYYQASQYVEDFAAVDFKDVIKIALCDPLGGNARDHILAPLEPIFGSEKTIQLALSGAIWLDVNPAGINKGTAIKKLQEIWGIKPEECVAFGDYLNDVEMLQAVKYSYAMANAIPEVKAVAKYQAPSNNDEGVIKIMAQILQQGGNLA